MFYKSQGYIYSYREMYDDIKYRGWIIRIFVKEGSWDKKYFADDTSSSSKIKDRKNFEELLHEIDGIEREKAFVEELNAKEKET